jgi:hypothetical protein
MTEISKDADNPDKKRPDPRHGLIDEYAHQREDSHDEPVKAEERHHREHRCAGLGDEQ